jgi:hypothetical protein
MKRLLALVLLITPCFAGAQDFSSLEERMSAADFRAAGLDKLSDQELAQLNAWLRANVGGAQAAAAGQPSPADLIGFRPAAPTGEVVSQIDGPFTGWDGHTEFRLQNGQVWVQADSADRFRSGTIMNPGVRIEPGMMDSWVLRVDGFNHRVKVRRIK